VADAKLEVRVRRLQPRDDRSGFRSGNINLDRFFQQYAGQNQFRHHIGASYVAVHGDQIAGFVTVSSGELVAEKLTRNLRRRLPSYPLPILRMARLAVDQRYQGHGIGRLLLRAMLELALDMRERAGCIGMVVDAKPDAITFYSSLGFFPIDLISGALGDRPEPVAMFLPIGQVAAAIKDAMSRAKQGTSGRG
jgi:GNAT superfamily N-acetyltransferase